METIQQNQTERDESLAKMFALAGDDYETGLNKLVQKVDTMFKTSLETAQGRAALRRAGFNVPRAKKK